jgi:hypothetical protein
MIIKRDKEFSWFSNLFKRNNKSINNIGAGIQQKNNITNSSFKSKNDKIYIGEEFKEVIDNLSPTHKVLRLIIEKLQKKYPDRHNSDYGPCVFLDQCDFPDVNSKVGDLHLDTQMGNVYRWTGKYWEEIENCYPKPSRKIYNLKQELLNEIKLYRKEEKELLEELGEEYGTETLDYLDDLEKEIKKSKL